MTCYPTRQDGTVLAGVKATPFGWPTTSLAPGSGRRPSAAIGGRPQFQDQNPSSHVSTVSGDCRPGALKPKLRRF
jgi:hypothetical protein